MEVNGRIDWILLYTKKRFTAPFMCTLETYTKILSELSDRLGPHYEFGIARYSEGGIEFISWPGKSIEGHRRGEKTIRFATSKEWYSFQINGSVQLNNGTHVGLCMKTCDSAPKFNRLELKAIYDSFKAAFDDQLTHWKFYSYNSLKKT